MKGHALPWGFVLLMAWLGAGCSAPTATAPQDTVDPATIAQSFTIKERRPGSRTAATPESTLVDYASTISFHPDREQLARAIGASGATDPALSRADIAELDREIASLEQELAAFKSFDALVDRIAEYQRLSLAFWSSDPPLGATVQADPAWRQLTTLQVDIIDGLKTSIQTFIKYHDFGGKLDWKVAPQEGTPEAEARDRANDREDEIYGRMVPNVAPNAQRVFVPDEVTRLLNDTTALLTDRLERLNAAVLAKAPHAQLEMEAHLRRGDDRLPVSISPYSIVEGPGRGGKSPRIGVPSQQDLARVQKAYEINAALAKSVNELRDLARDPKKLDELKAQLRKAIEAAATRLKTDLQNRLQRIIGIDKPSVATIRSAAEALKTEVDMLVVTWQTFLQSMPTDPIALVNAIVTRLDSLRATQLRTRLQALLTALGTIPPDLEADATKLLAETKDQLTQEQKALLDALNGVPAIGGFANALASLKAAAMTASFGGLKPTRITSIPMALGAAQAGIVDLDQTVAESGDRLEVTYRLVPNPQEPETQPYVASESLDVRKFGFYSTFKSQILFYDRLHDDSSVYSAAPGVCYNLHYRPDCAQVFHDVLAPGIGASVSAPSFENGTELAIGLQLTFFNDMLQVGYAYNISVEDQQEMFYFGLDLISVFQGFR